MSQALIRRGLDLYKDDLKGTSSGAEGKIKNIATTKLAEKDITKLVGTNKKGFKRKLKRLRAKQSVATLKDKKVKSADDLYETYTRKDQTQANLQALDYMKLLNTDEQKTIEQAASRHQGEKNRKKKKEPKDNTEPTSVFSEKDFEEFFKDYNFT